MDVAELLVERFLTRNGLAFVCSQYELKQDAGWTANFDFVALSFVEKLVVLVEVTEGGGLGSVANKAEKCKSDDYLGRLSRAICEQTNEATKGWPCHFLGFVKDDELVRSAYSQFPNDFIHFRPLRDTIEDSWDRRDLGLLPSRPVTG